MTYKSNFYLSIINELKVDTNLSRIRKKLKISRQKLNYYLRRLKKQGFLIHKDRGWYEPTKKCKNPTKYDIFLNKDFTRGHAYIWNIKFKVKPKNWNKRLKILEKNQINYKLVGALKTTPRIKTLGRKIWLCNDHIRVYDKKKASYYGKNAVESRYIALHELKRIVWALERKLGISLDVSQVSFQKEHYALIKNDLAIQENRKGNIWRINDENGEWLLIDDSLGEGGELETVGKKAFKNNIPLQKWWNEHKEHNFKITPSFLMENINKVAENQLMFAKNIEKHMEVLDDMSKTLKKIQENLK